MELYAICKFLLRFILCKFTFVFLRSNAILSISRISSINRRVSSAKSVSKRQDTTNTKYDRIESDSHADTTVAGANCIVLQYTGKECDVAPYREDYETVKGIPIVHAY